ncbi:MAG TPA: 8-oxoguanine deaminase [Actinomycetales bacterium]|nr:8-oxoguanine deaminase [Actinomycetales bacterium]
MSALVVEGCAVATVDNANARYPDGHVVVTDGVITAVGPGPAPRTPDATHVDGRGCLLTPGFVNTHHHLYQWATRGFAANNTLFEWLTTLYPVWAGLDADIVRAAATAGLARLAATGCTTTSDHHYVFPRDGGDVLDATVDAARSVGLRLTATRGSMDVGQSAGGLPPDNVVEDVDAVLKATAEAVARYHDASPGSMLRVAAAPCSPFSVSTRLLVEAAAQARELGVRLHTHLAETLDEETYCADRFGCTPVEHLDGLGWLGPDVWLAHCVHPGEAGVARLAATGTGVAHCPQSNARLGAGTAPVRAMLDASVPVGLGVDGAASNEQGALVDELRQAVYVARLSGGPTALAAHEALRLATAGGAAVLGRADEIGALRVGLRGDLALWRVDGPLHADLDDPVVALVLGPTPPLELLTVEGRPVVERGQVLTVDVEQVGRALLAARRRLLARAPG